MEENYMLAFSSPVGDTDAEFNRWYDDVHVPEVCDASGITLARRYVAGPGFMGRPAPPHKYLALYDLGSDPLARIEALEQMRREKVVTPSDTNDPSSLYLWRYRALGPPFRL